MKGLPPIEAASFWAFFAQKIKRIAGTWIEKRLNDGVQKEIYYKIKRLRNLHAFGILAVKELIKDKKN